MLYDCYAQTIYNLIYRIVGDLDLAADLLVETLWEAWQIAPSLPEDGDFCTSWLYNLARQQSSHALQSQLPLSTSVPVSSQVLSLEMEE